jgi:hypothetical protein
MNELTFDLMKKSNTTIIRMTYNGTDQAPNGLKFLSSLRIHQSPAKRGKIYPKALIPPGIDNI